MKKVICLFLSIMMLLSITTGIDLSAYAALADSGSCGDSVTYTFDSESGTLTLEGTGKIDDYSYTSTTCSPFANNLDIKSVIFRDGITGGGSYLFYGCSKINSISFANSLLNVEKGMFEGCTSLVQVILPDNIESIKESSFRSCTGLIEISLPSYTSIGNNAFYDVTTIRKVTITKGNGTNWSNYSSASATPWYNSRNNLKTIIIEDGVPGIGTYMFASLPNITSITLPNSITAINNYAFNSDTSLTSIVIPKNVKTIGSYAFGGCTSLRSVVFNDCTPEILDHTFYNCSLLSEINIEKAKTISNNAFENCSALTAATISNQVQAIGNSAFKGCSKLQTVSLGESVETIETSAFEGCTWLNSITLNEGLTTINENVFKNCTSLTTVNIPSSVSQINRTAFSYTTNLRAINVADGNEEYKSINGDLCDKSGMLIKYCVGKTDTEYVVPEGITSIGQYAFERANNLKKVTIGNDVRSIGYAAFDQCQAITDLTIGDNVETIGQYACSGCTSLLNLSIPSSTAISNNNAFYDVTTIRKVTITKGNGINWRNYGSYSATPWYKSRDNLKTIVIENGVPGIGNYMFTSLPNVTSIIIPESVTSIGTQALFGSFKDIYFRNKDITIADAGNTINSSAIIHGYDESTAQAYAEKHSRTFKIFDHTPGEIQIENVVEPTCTSKGSHDEVTYCTECGIEVSQTTVVDEMLEHTLVTIPIKAATCTTSGLTEGSYCTVCEQVIVPQEIVNATGHHYEAVVVAPTCRTKGYTEYTCKDCSESYRADYVNTTDEHDYKAAVTKQPTCATEGVTTYTCTICENIYTEPIAKLAHTPAEVVKENEKPATCTAKGSYDLVVYCSECNTELSRDTKELEIIDHTPVTDKAVAPTCEQTGFTEGSHCSVCGEILVAQNTINAKGHTPVTDKAVPATFKAAGKTAGSHCSTCGKVLVAQKIVAKLNSPSLNKVTAGKKQFKATWKSVANIDGYQIQYSTDKNFKKGNKTVTVKGYKATSKAVKKLAAKKKYYVRIRGYKKINGKNQYSAWSKSKAVTTKK